VHHVSPNQVVRFVAGELSADERGVLQAHLAACRACRAQVEAQQALHETLGDWVAEPAGLEVTEATLRLVDAAAALPPQGSGASQRSRLVAALRVAAAVGLGVGLGHATGRWVFEPQTVDRVPVIGESGPPSYGLLSEPDVVGLWMAYDDLNSPHAEDGS
jgi:anti-sigma factor RsiW